MFFELLLFVMDNYYVEDVSEDTLIQIATDAGWDTTKGSIQDWAYEVKFG